MVSLNISKKRHVAMAWKCARHLKTEQIDYEINKCLHIFTKFKLFNTQSILYKTSPNVMLKVGSKVWDFFY